MNAVILATENGYRWEPAGTVDEENRLANTPDFICIVPIGAIVTAMAILNGDGKFA